MAMKDTYRESQDNTSRPDHRYVKWKQYGILGGVGVLIVSGLGLYLAHDAENVTPIQSSSEPRFSLTEHADRDTFYARYDARFADMELQLSKLNTLITKYHESMTKIDQGLESLAQTVKSHQATLDTLQSETQRLSEVTVNDEKRRAQPGSLAQGLQSSLLADQADLFGSDASRRSHRPTESGATPETIASGHLTEIRFALPARETSDAQLNANRATTSGTPVQTLSSPSVSSSHSNNATSGPRVGPSPYLKPDTPLPLNRAQGAQDYVAAGSFVKGALLTGVYTPTGAGAASLPMPVMIRLTDNAILPNKQRAKLKGCFLTGAATGDLSSERIHVRLDRLSCMRPDGSALDVKVAGYTVGEDGKVGLRGKLITRSGQAVASAISVGLLGGVGRAMSLSSEDTTTSITGTQTTTVKNAWVNGLGRGMSDAMNRLVDYYLKVADRIFPVLEISSGRTVDVVFSQGVLLSNGDAQRPSQAPSSLSSPPSPALRSSATSTLGR